MATIFLENVTKKFDDHWVTRGVTLAIPTNSMTVIIGKSGEGKSVLLKQMIGLIAPTSGSIVIDGVDITRVDEAKKRDIFARMGYVFQFAALLDSLTIFENVALPCAHQKQLSERVILDLVKEKLSLVGLSSVVLNKYPSELSGGMRKRVGLARTLMTNPEIILYDEPTTGLDPITARLIHELMYSMQQKLNITSVIVSHDTQIFNYADRVALLYQGKIEHVTDAQSIWDSKNRYIHQFIRGLVTGPMVNDSMREGKIILARHADGKNSKQRTLG